VATAASAITSCATASQTWTCSTQHLQRDLDAVIAGLRLPWKSGVVEGHVNRIKMLKRQMYGRADSSASEFPLAPQFGCWT
jgi:transposase